MKGPLLACLGLMAALVPGPAVAASTYVAVTDEGPGVSALNLSCANPTLSSTLPKHFTHVSGPAAPPLGTGSLRLDPSTNERAGLAFESGTRVVSDLAVPGAFAVSAYSPGGTGVLSAYVRASRGGGTWHGVATLATTGAWSTLDLSGATYHWVDNNNLNGVDLTLAQFVETKGDGGFRAGVMVDGCPGNTTPVYLDRLVGNYLALSPQTIDFEEFYATTLKVSGGGLIVAGQPATLTGALTSNGPPLKSNQSLRFQADPWPFDGVFVDLGIAGTNDDGQASAVDLPLVNTTYRWVYAGVQSFAPAVSDSLVLDVSPAVTMAMKDTTLKLGDKVVVTGTTTPVKSRVAVSLWRRTKGDHITLLKRGTTRADGSYRFTKRLKARGKWRIYVVVAANEGNVQGKSYRIKVRVT